MDGFWYNSLSFRYNIGFLSPNFEFSSNLKEVQSLQPKRINIPKDKIILKNNKL